MNRTQRRLAARSTAGQTRAEQNQRNSQASTGPITVAGKEASKMNALRHGLTAQNPVLPTDNRNDYEAHVSHWFETLAPEGFLETELVQTIADTYWRVNRIPALEAKLVAKDIDVLKMVKALDSLSRHEMRLRKLISKTLDQLVTIKTDHHRQQKQSQLNNQKPQNGFVFAKLQTPSPQAGPQGFADPETESFDTQENGCEAVEEVAQAA